MTDTPKTLAPCPFCGGEASRPYKGHGGDKVKCHGCGATIRAERWNRRPLPADDEVVERVARALCEGAVGGRCACSGGFSCADEYPGRQARAAIAAMRGE